MVIGLEPLRKEIEKTLACLAILSNDCHPVRASEIARKMRVDRWVARRYLLKLVEKGMVKRIDVRYVVVLEEYVLYLLSIYGGMTITEMFEKTMDISGINPDEKLGMDFKSNLRKTLRSLLSRNEVSVDNRGRYRVAGIGEYVVRVISDMGIEESIDRHEGMTLITVYCPDRFRIYAYEGLTVADVDFILFLDEEELFSEGEDADRFRRKMWRILRILSVMLNEKIGILNISTYIGRAERILVIVEGDDISGMGQEVINEANRKISKILSIIENKRLGRGKEMGLKWSSIILQQRYALENALSRMVALIRRIRESENIEILFVKEKSLIEKEIKKRISDWCNIS